MTINELASKITELRKAYWDGTCTTPDSEYDTLIEELRKLDPNHPLLTTPEHGEMVGAEVVHKVPMLSLQKVYTEQELIDWVNKIARSESEEFLIQPKYDGVSCHYDNGVYSTRGDGQVGENVTNVCNAICKAELASGVDCTSYYGELVIKNSDFSTIYKNNIKTGAGTPFKNSRNAIAGMLGTDDYGFYAKQGAVITLIDYRKYSFKASAKDFSVKWPIVKQMISTLDYPMDGIVVKLADNAYVDQLGSTSHHPRGAMAFKFANECATTELVDIEWGMGKNSITATAIFEPISIGGTTITRAVVPMVSKTLPCIANGDFFKGASLIVERAGDVIPHIVNVSKPSPMPVSIFGGAPIEPFKLDVCPFCGTPLVFEESAVRCPNDDCCEKKVQRLYCSLITLGVENIGIATVRQVSEYIKKWFYVDANLLNWMKYSDTTDFTSRLVNENGFGNASVNAIVAQTIKIAHTTLAKFLAALNIPGVGIKAGTLLMDKYKLEELLCAGEAELTLIPGIGSTIAKRIVEYIVLHKNYIRSLAMCFEFEEQATTQANGAGNAKTVCFTGAMRVSRSQMQALAKQSGFMPIDSVTKALDILVIADGVDRTSSKCVKAQKYGTTVMTESEFISECNKKTQKN